MTEETSPEALTVAAAAETPVADTSSISTNSNRDEESGEVPSNSNENGHIESNGNHHEEEGRLDDEEEQEE